MNHSYEGGSADGEGCKEGGGCFLEKERERRSEKEREGAQERGRGELFRVATW